MTKIEFGVGLPSSGAAEQIGAQGLIGAALQVEQAGLDAVSISDVLLGDGTPALESVVAATAAATATERVRVEFGVLVLPTRQLAWLGAQIAALQHLSGDRVVLGVGAGGFPSSPFWRAVRAPRRGRGQVVDSMLAALPQLIAGEPTQFDDELVTLSPSAPVPPILVGGHSDRAVRRAARHADGWFPSLMSPHILAGHIAELRELAAAHGRRQPRVHFGTHAALGPDSSARRAELIQTLTEEFGMPSLEAEALPITGGSAEVADRVARYADAGVDSITLSLDGQHWESQLEVVAEARRLVHES